jgi:hypothetical protein
MISNWPSTALVLYAKALCINVSAVALGLWWLQGPAS